MAMAAPPTKTASTHRAAFVHGTHLFDILGYGALKAIGRSHSVTSTTFRVAGRDWTVVCGFDGQPLALAHVSLHLHDVDAYSLEATASFSIDDPNGGGRRPMRIGEEEVPVADGSCKVAVPEAFRRLEARYVKDGRLRIRCTVRVLDEDSGPAPTSYCFVAAPPPPDVTLFLRVLLDSGQRADVTFAVEDSCRFDAHRAVLAMRSPVFRAKFFGDTRDSSLRWFRVHDVSAAVFGAMLHFIYTDELPSLDPDPDLERDLLVAADLYGLDRLRLMCEKMLWDRVRADGGVGSAISTLSLVSGRDDCRQLQDLCIGYVAKHWEAATATEEYREIKTSCPAFLSSVLENVIAEQRRSTAGSTTTTTAEKKHRSSSLSVYRPSEVWRGRHQLTILGHSVVRRTHGNGEFISSGAFEVGGHEWRLLYYPSGYDDDDEHEGQVSVFLELATTPSIDPDVVLEASGTVVVVGSRVKSTTEFGHRYTHDVLAEGCRIQLDMASSRSRLVGPDDTLTLECSFEFQVANKTTTTIAVAQEQEPEPDIVVPPPSISWHLQRLLETGVGSDVTFSIPSFSGEEEEELHAHTLVLSARAPALLRPSPSSKEAAETWKKKTTKKKKKQQQQQHSRRMIRIEGGVKAAVFRALLHFVYTDELPPLDDLARAAAAGAAGNKKPSASGTTRMVGELLAAAERYQLVERMRPLCENLLCELMAPENAAATLEVASRHGRRDLKAFCLQYLTSPGVLKAVVARTSEDIPAEVLRDILTHIAQSQTLSS